MKSNLMDLSDLVHTPDHRDITIAGGTDGHYYDDILEYNPGEDTILSIGHMSQTRDGHAVSVVQVQDYIQWCQ